MSKVILDVAVRRFRLIKYSNYFLGFHTYPEWLPLQVTRCYSCIDNSMGDSLCFARSTHHSLHLTRSAVSRLAYVSPWGPHFSRTPCYASFPLTLFGNHKGIIMWSPQSALTRRHYVIEGFPDILCYRLQSHILVSRDLGLEFSPVRLFQK